MTASNGEGRLAGKVVLMSGTAGGLGRVAAEIFSREGARLVTCDLDGEGDERTAQAVRDQGGEILSTSPLDLAEPEQAREWVRRGAEQFGGIDILYNNAGTPRFGGIDQMSPEDWSFTLRNELELIWFSCQAAWPALVARGGGAIVNVGSIAAHVGMRGNPAGAHVAAKGAVTALTRQLAAEGAAVNIRVNCFSPAVVDGPAARVLLDMGEDSPLASLISHNAFGRLTTPEEAVYPGLFLASDEASAITGVDLLVDGGASVLL
jgi:meso-butanediol dehydrogenase/(S,S)-butanediol dehydrogenase/diacetyl reductase